jgi:hypothetical protein
MKILIAVLIIIFGVIWAARDIHAGYEYSTAIGSYWSLSEKASTLQQKSTYLDKYVEGLEAVKLASHDAIIFPTPDNDVEQNLVALKSLQGRMHQIQGMDEQSFAYQTAIQQITAQEQGEAGKLTETFEGAWMLANHPSLWGWIDGLVWTSLAIGLVVLFVSWIISDDL